MLGLLKRLFRNNSTAEKPPQGRSGRTVGDLTPDSREVDPVRLYYDTMSKMQGAISRGDYDTAARFISENLSRIPAWITETLKQYGSFNISSIPALQDGG